MEGIAVVGPIAVFAGDIGPVIDGMIAVRQIMPNLDISLVKMFA